MGWWNVAFPGVQSIFSLSSEYVRLIERTRQLDSGKMKTNEINEELGKLCQHFKSFLEFLLCNCAQRNFKKRKWRKSLDFPAPRLKIGTILEARKLENQEDAAVPNSNDCGIFFFLEFYNNTNIHDTKCYIECPPLTFHWNFMRSKVHLPV